MISTPWSYSKLSLYKRCPAAFKFRYIDKIRTESGPAAARGTKIHEDIEKYIRGYMFDKNITEELGIHKNVAPILNDFRYEFNYGLRGITEYNSKMWSECVGTEVEVQVDGQWNMVDSGSKYWAKFIFDIVRYMDKEVKTGNIVQHEAIQHPFAAEIYDIKTGRAYDTHRDQAIIYALAYWKLTGFNPQVSFLYVDKGELVDYAFSNEELAAEEFSIRALLDTIDADTQFDCSGRGCHYCDFKKIGVCV